MTKKNNGWIIGTVVALAAGGWFFTKGMGGGGDGEIEYRYAKATGGELARSISATGQLIALTSVDIRSKAGGRVDKILVEEGDRVTEGQLLAKIDPSDTKATVEQAQADLQSASARADAARINYSLEEKNRRNAVQDARNALQIARVRYQRAQTTASTQPSLTSSNMRSARASLASA